MLSLEIATEAKEFDVPEMTGTADELERVDDSRGNKSASGTKAADRIEGPNDARGDVFASGSRGVKGLDVTNSSWIGAFAETFSLMPIDASSIANRGGGLSSVRYEDGRRFLTNPSC